MDSPVYKGENIANDIELDDKIGNLFVFIPK